MIAAGHAEIAQHELRKEGQVEANEQDECGDPRQPLRILATSDLRPPEVQATEIAHDRSAHHDVVEVGDDEIGVVDVHVDAEAAEEQSGKPADEEQSQESEGIEHRRVEGDGAAEQGGGPIENFYRGWNGDQESEKRKCQRGVGRTVR